MTKERDNQHGPDWTAFRGYSTPNYTMVPDELFDEHLPFLSGAELKVLLYIIRRTFGFKKDSDSISLSQMLHGITTHDGRTLDRGAGLSKPTLLQALRSLIGKNLILSERQRSHDRGDEPTIYQLRLSHAHDRRQKSIPPVVKKFDQGGGEQISPRGRSKNLTTQETELQETVKQNKDRSNIRLTSPSKKGKKADISPANHAQETDHDPQPKVHTETTPDRPKSPQTGFTFVGALLPQIPPKTAARAPSDTSQGVFATGPHIEVPAQIRQIVEQATQEFHDDPEKLLANLTRAMNLYQRSGLSEYGFCRVLLEAQAATKRAGTIQKLSSRPGWQGLKNKVPYWYTVVENRLKELQLEEQAQC